MFQSVTQDAANVYFTLADGTLITIAKGDNTNYLYTITYMPNGGVGEEIIDTVFYGDSYSIRDYVIYTKEGYDLESWNTNPDGHGTHFYLGRTINAVSRNITLYAQWRAYDGIENGYYYVDLGLPSGLKWATCNVGATTSEEYGNYYAWGETTPKYYYNWSTYKYGYELNMTKYCNDASCGKDGFTDAKTVLDLEDDAAHVNWGGSWRMPTRKEWKEMVVNCTWTWTSDYNGTGVAGRIVTSNTNGNAIFLPAAGYRRDADLINAGGQGEYWSSSLRAVNMDHAWRIHISSLEVKRYGYSRQLGLSARPVL